MSSLLSTNLQTNSENILGIKDHQMTLIAHSPPPNLQLKKKKKKGKNWKVVGF